MHNQVKLRDKASSIFKSWNLSLSSEESCLFTEVHVISVIYELIENPKFNFRSIGGPQVIFVI